MTDKVSGRVYNMHDFSPKFVKNVMVVLPCQPFALEYVILSYWTNNNGLFINLHVLGPSIDHHHFRMHDLPPPLEALFAPAATLI